MNQAIASGPARPAQSKGKIWHGRPAPRAFKGAQPANDAASPEDFNPQDARRVTVRAAGKIVYSGPVSMQSAMAIHQAGLTCKRRKIYATVTMNDGSKRYFRGNGRVKGRRPKPWPFR